MARLVLKFGGTSLADMERLRHAAAHVGREVEAGHEVTVVVSAMAGVTNQLINWTREAATIHDAREYDAVVSTGEQVTSGLLVMILQNNSIAARSWLGWQVPIITSGVHGAARIENIDITHLNERLAQKQVPVVAGFQGVGPDNRITTLGRGGSDTSAVALAVALGADRCDIYTDVEGVYTADPRMVVSARKIDRVTYEEMLEMASLGAKVLQTRSVELAMAHDIKLCVRSSFASPEEGDSPFSGTLVCGEDKIMEQEIVSGITYAHDEAKITLVQVADKPGVAADIFDPLADVGINVDMIVQNVSENGEQTDVTFTVSRNDLPEALKIMENCRDALGYRKIISAEDVAKVSVVGVGMRSHAGSALRMFRALADKGINIQVISTSEIKISVLIEEQYTELAVRALHTAYGLDGA
ncbi:MAG: aspartate kinase [Parvularculales bacterium]